MCGIAGFFTLSRTTELDVLLLEKMQATIAHRGPDGYRVWVSQEHGLAITHRRLSIMDLSQAGFQPMFDDERTVMVCCNGEIYNHPSLRAELERKGYVYRSHSDTETILFAYKEWGIEALNRLEGMFAIVIYDFVKSELFLVRDRMGIKPLYFSLQGGMLSFASEIKALWCLPWMTKTIKTDAVYHYLTYLVTPAPMTLYQDVYKLPSAYYIKVDAQKNISYVQWYTPLLPAINYTAEQVADEAFCVDELRRLLRNSVEQQMMSNVPFGVFLSGGIDSSLNVALMSRLTDRVNTFTVAFADGPEYNELQWAKRVAERFNTRHHEIVITEQEAYQFFESMVYHQDEPLGDCVCVPLYYVSKLLKESGVTVVQVGEGSDELFCGYNLYAQYLSIQRPWHATQRYVPAVARKSVHWLAAQLFPAHYNRLDVIKNWAYDRSLFWGGAVVFSETWKKELMQPASRVPHDPVIEAMYPGFGQQLDSHALPAYHLQEFQRLMPQADYLAGMTYVELKHRLAELLLMRVDKMTMATSVEARVPFLDHKLVEFALQIPQSLKYRNNQTKYILKKACEGILPDDVIYRKKMGFAAPTTRWFKQGRYFPALLTDLLHDSHNELAKLFDVGFVERMMNDTQKTTADYSYQLWALQNLLACGAI